MDVEEKKDEKEDEKKEGEDEKKELEEAGDDRKRVFIEEEEVKE